MFMVLYTMKVKVTQSRLTLCDPMDYTVHRILQARILEWVAYPFSRGSYWPIELGSPALQANSLPTELPGKPSIYYGSNPNMPRQTISFRRRLCLSLSHTHTLEYYSAIKDQILPFVPMWMDLKNIMLSEISWKKTNTVWYHVHVDSKYNTNEYICKNVDSQIEKTNLWLPEGRRKGERQIRGSKMTDTNYCI